MDLLNEAFGGNNNNFDPSNISIGSMMDLFRENDDLREKYTDEEKVFLAKLVLAVFEMAMRGFENMDDLDIDDDDMFQLISEIFGVSLGADIIEFMNALNDPAKFNPEWGAVMKNYNINFDVFKQQYRRIEGTNRWHWVDERLNPVDLLIDYIERQVMGAIQLVLPQIAGDIRRYMYGEDANQLRIMFENNSPWSMMIDDANLLRAYYDVIGGRLPNFGSPEAKNEIVLVVDEFNQLDDFTLFLLGVISIDSFGLTVVNQIRSYLPPEADRMVGVFLPLLFHHSTTEVKHEYHFNDFIGSPSTMPATFVLRTPTDYYAPCPITGVYNQTGEGIEVEVVGILRLKPDVAGGVISGAIGYTEALAHAFINNGNNAPVVKALNQAFDEFNANRTMLVDIAMRVVGLGGF
jgi:hypothetical protein